MPRRPAPNKLWICVTNRCNLTCPHCLPDSRRAMDNEMDRDEILSLIHQAHALGVQRITFTGGEPTLCRDLLEYVRVASKGGAVRTYVETNAMTIRAPQLLKLRAAGLSILNLSLDGATALTHDGFRGAPGGFEKVLDTARTAGAIGLDVRIYCTVTQHDIDEAHLIPQLLDDLGIRVNVLTYAYFTEIGRGSRNSDLSLPPVRWKKFCDDLEASRAHWEPRIGKIRYEPAFLRPDEVMHYRDNTSFNVHCIARERDYVFVNPEGEVFGCSIASPTENSLGNLRSQSLESIWYDAPGWAFFEKRKGCAGCPVLAFESDDGRDPRLDRADGLIPICPMTQFPQVENWVYK